MAGLCLPNNLTTTITLTTNNLTGLSGVEPSGQDDTTVFSDQWGSLLFSDEVTDAAAFNEVGVIADVLLSEAIVNSQDDPPFHCFPHKNGVEDLPQLDFLLHTDETNLQLDSPLDSPDGVPMDFLDCNMTSAESETATEELFGDIQSLLRLDPMNDNDAVSPSSFGSDDLFSFVDDLNFDDVENIFDEEQCHKNDEVAEPSEKKQSGKDAAQISNMDQGQNVKKRRENKRKYDRKSAKNLNADKSASGRDVKKLRRENQRKNDRKSAKTYRERRKEQNSAVFEQCKALEEKNKNLKLELTELEASVKILRTLLLDVMAQ